METPRTSTGPSSNDRIASACSAASRRHRRPFGKARPAVDEEDAPPTRERCDRGACRPLRQLRVDAGVRQKAGEVEERPARAAGEIRQLRCRSPLQVHQSRSSRS
jgi:hypothetical protein